MKHEDVDAVPPRHRVDPSLARAGVGADEDLPRPRRSAARPGAAADVPDPAAPALHRGARRARRPEQPIELRPTFVKDLEAGGAVGHLPGTGRRA